MSLIYGILILGAATAYTVYCIGTNKRWDVFSKAYHSESFDYEAAHNDQLPSSLNEVQKCQQGEKGQSLTQLPLALELITCETQRYHMPSSKTGNINPKNFGVVTLTLNKDVTVVTVSWFTWEQQDVVLQALQTTFDPANQF